MVREGLRPVVVLTIEYADEMHQPAAVEIQTGVPSVGRTSLVVGQRDRPNSRITAIALAMSNGEGPIPDSLRAAYALVMIREEPEAKNICARL